MYLNNTVIWTCRKKSERCWSYQFPSQPGQCTLYVQFSAFPSRCAPFTEAVSPAPRIPACTLPCWFTVIEGGGLAGEVPQSG